MAKRRVAAIAEYEGARDGLITALESEEGTDWDIGKHWKTLHKKKLWKAGGYDSAEAFIAGELEPRGLQVPKPSTLVHYGQVADTFGRDVTIRVGMYRLIRALTLWRSIGKTNFSRTDPGSELIDVPDAPAPKALQSCTEADLERAIAAASPKKKGGLSVEDAALQALLNTALEKALGSKGKGSVKLSRREGELYMSPLSVTAPFKSLTDIFHGLTRRS